MINILAILSIICMNSSLHAAASGYGGYYSSTRRDAPARSYGGYATSSADHIIRSLTDLAQQTTQKQPDEWFEGRLKFLLAEVKTTTWTTDKRKEVLQQLINIRDNWERWQPSSELMLTLENVISQKSGALVLSNLTRLFEYKLNATPPVPTAPQAAAAQAPRPIAPAGSAVPFRVQPIVMPPAATQPFQVQPIVIPPAAAAPAVPAEPFQAQPIAAAPAIPEDLNYVDSTGMTALMRAIVCKDFSLTELLIRNGANLDIQDNYGMTALMRAILCKDFSLTELLIRNGANLNLQDNKGMTALTIAVEMHYSKYDLPIYFVETLIKAGANTHEAILWIAKQPINKRHDKITKLLASAAQAPRPIAPAGSAVPFQVQPIVVPPAAAAPAGSAVPFQVQPIAVPKVAPAPTVPVVPAIAVQKHPEPEIEVLPNQKQKADKLRFIVPEDALREEGEEKLFGIGSGGGKENQDAGNTEVIANPALEFIQLRSLSDDAEDMSLPFEDKSVQGFTLYTDNALQRDNKVSFVFATRGEDSYIPVPDTRENMRTIIVLTSSEFTDLNPTIKEKIRKNNVDVLTIDVSYDISPYLRKRACLKFAIQKQIKNAFFIEDNIQRLEWKNADITSFAEIFKELQKKQFLMSSLAERKNSSANEIASGILFINLSSLSKLIRVDSLFALFPEQENIWGDNLFFQICVSLLKKKATIFFPNGDIWYKKAQDLLPPSIKARPLAFTAEHMARVEQAGLTQVVEAACAIFNKKIEEAKEKFSQRLAQLKAVDLEGWHAAQNHVKVDSSEILSRGVGKDRFNEQLVSLINEVIRLNNTYPDEGLRLKPHQIDALSAYAKKLGAGTENNYSFQLATGTGKSFIQVLIALLALKISDGNIVIVAPYRHLVEQLYKHALEYMDAYPFLNNLGIPKNKIIKISSGDRAIIAEAVLKNNSLLERDRHLFLICKDSYIQLMQNENFKNKTQFIIFDESHLTAVSNIPKGALLFSATLAKKQNPVFDFNYQKAIDADAISPLFVDACTVSQDSLTEEAIWDMLKKYMHPKKGVPLSTLKGAIFVSTTKAAKSLAEAGLEQDMNIFEIHSKNDDAAQDLEKFKKQNTGIAIAVRMLAEGFDDKKLEWVLLLRGFQENKEAHQQRLQQIIGRVLRKNNHDPDKIGIVLSTYPINVESYGSQTVGLPKALPNLLVSSEIELDPTLEKDDEPTVKQAHTPSISETESETDSDGDQSMGSLEEFQLQQEQQRRREAELEQEQQKRLQEDRERRSKEERERRLEEERLRAERELARRKAENPHPAKRRPPPGGLFL